uniref:G-protein coupled receptors family 1 profile domain-containing protein n=1 Tax=Acrobeloides nanus TaxID=290746 RepID=A0A914C4H1_9BILA
MDVRSGKLSNVETRIVSDRTTVMLLIILIVFLVTELPQGVLSIFIAIYTNDVYNYIYRYLGDVLDLLSLINSSVNFVLYCLMSSRYRHTFCAVMMPRSVAKCIKTRQQSANNTNYYSNSDYNPVRIRKVSEFPLAKKRWGIDYDHSRALKMLWGHPDIT